MKRNTKKALAPKVVRGGRAVPLGDNFYYMQGRKHKDGGIDIGEDAKTGLEVEDGEVMHISSKEAKVFSAQPLLNGKSPAKKVMGGENPSKVFDAQENFKDRNGLNDDGTMKKNAGNKNNKRNKAFIGTSKDNDDLNLSDDNIMGLTPPELLTLNMSDPNSTGDAKPTIGQRLGIVANNRKNTINNVIDGITRGASGVRNYYKDNPGAVEDSLGLLSNVAGGLIGHNVNKRMLNDLKYTKQPAARQPTKLKTTININPQLDKMRESLSAYERDVDSNTASSRVALARKQRARLATQRGTNELYGNKENQETQLINQDRLNQQRTSELNLADYNRWAEGGAAFRNAVREKRSENTIGLIEGINSGIQDIISRGEKRRVTKDNIATMAAANPNVNPRILKDLGVSWVTDDFIKEWEKAQGKNKTKDSSKD